MTELFLTLFNRAVAAGWLVLAVLVLRLLLKKAPKWTRVLLWGLVAVRLLCPFTLESIWSLIPSAETIAPEALLEPVPTIHSGISSLNSVVNPVLEQSFAAAPEYSANPLQIWTGIAAAVWAAGVAVLLAYAAISYFRLKQRMATAVRMQENLYRSELVGFPFVLGIVYPKIYLPVSLEGEALSHVIAHEQAHIQRRDHWWKPLGFLLLTIYWFQPLLWVAYVLLCRDIELACDEKVIRDMGRDQRADYSQALLQCSIRRRSIAACPLAFGEVGVKERVKNVLNYRKPAFWVIVAAVIACIVAAVCFLTDPPVATDDLEPPQMSVHLVAGDTTTEVIPTYFTERFQFDYNRLITLEVIDTATLYLTPGWHVDTLTVVEQYSERKGTAVTTFCETLALEADADGTVALELRHRNIQEAEQAVYHIHAGSGEYALKVEFPARREALSLTLEDVLTLAGKGNALTWLDFANYAYTETGSGLYIRAYEIDGTFSLMIGGPSPDEAPMYIRLCAGDAGENAIDIREENVQAFIEAHAPSYLCVFTQAYDMEPFVTFYPDGTYCFTYAMISSTLGHGTYALSGERLILTDDTGTQYVFAVDDDALVYDAAASGEQHWLSDLPDGAVFTRTHGDANAWETVLSLARQQRAAELVSVICTSPAEASNPGAYLEAHPTELAELVSLGEDTLRYAFGRFLQGSETGLEGHILAEACQKILEEQGLARTDMLYWTGQDWFHAFQDGTLQLTDEYSDAVLQEQYPAHWLLLQMMA